MIGDRMEIRKVQITGGSSFIITLPKTWVKKLNIKKNDPLGLVVQPDGSLVITKNVGEEQEERVMEIDVANVDTETYLFRCLIGAYIAGYTTIKIKSKPAIPPFVRAVVRKFTQATVGQEVVEETDTCITIKDLLNPAEMPFERSIRRMYMIARGMHRDAISILRNRNKMLAEDISHRDNDVDKLYWLIARQHNMVSININLARKMGVGTERVVNYFLISRIIERIADHAVRIARNIVNLVDEKVDKKIITAIESASALALEIFDESIKAFIKEDMRLANRNIESLTKLTSICEKIIRLALREKSAVAVSIGYITESIRRTGEYAADISECVINHLIGK